MHFTHQLHINQYYRIIVATETKESAPFGALSSTIYDLGSRISDLLSTFLLANCSDTSSARPSSYQAPNPSL